MDNELALRLFVSVVEEGGISRGGKRLGLPQSTSSRMIAQYEKRLGAKLLQRSTRKLSLTEAGKVFFSVPATLSLSWMKPQTPLMTYQKRRPAC
jgi:hypothetical protein